MYVISKRYDIDGKKFKCLIDTDELDRFDDSIQLLAKVDNGNCILTDDGYTKFNFRCCGQRLETEFNGDIVVKGKWFYLDKLVEKELKLIRQAYSKLKPVGEIND